MKKLLIASAALVAITAQAGWGDFGKAAAKDATTATLKGLTGSKTDEAKRENARSSSRAEMAEKAEKERKEKIAMQQKEELAKKDAAMKATTQATGMSELDQKIAAQQAKVDKVADWASFGPDAMFGLKFSATKEELKNSGKLTGWTDKSYKCVATLVKPFRKFKKVDLFFTPAGRLYKITTCADLESTEARDLEKTAIIGIFQKKFGDKFGVMDDNFRGTGMKSRIGIDWQVKRNPSDQWGCFMTEMQDNILVDHESVPNGKIWLSFSQLELRKYDSENVELQKLLKVKNSAQSSDEGMDAL